jgi:hypothetical protein
VQLIKRLDDLNRHHSRPLVRTCNLGRAGEDLPSRRHVAWSVLLARRLSSDWDLVTEWAAVKVGAAGTRHCHRLLAQRTQWAPPKRQSFVDCQVHRYAYDQLPGFPSYSSGVLDKIWNFNDSVCNVSFIVCVTLCAVFCLSVVCYFVWYVYFCVLCLIVVPLPLSKNPFAVQFIIIIIIIIIIIVVMYRKGLKETIPVYLETEQQCACMSVFFLKNFLRPQFY